MKKGGGHIFQLSLICTLKAIEVIKKVKKRKKDWVTGLRHLNTLCNAVIMIKREDYDKIARLRKMCYDENDVEQDKTIIFFDIHLF